MTIETEVETDGNDDAVRVALAGERLDVALDRRVTAQVFVESRTTEHVEQVAIDLQREHYEIERVAIDKVVSEAPSTRQEGDVTIIPVIEEEVVIQRRLILKEEIRIRKVVSVQQHVEDVVLRRQHAEIRRVPADEQVQTDLVSNQT